MNAISPDIVGQLALGDLSALEVRANPRYRFVAFGDLSPAQISSVSGIATAGQFKGLLIGSEDSSLTVKAISASAVDLFEALHVSCPVERFKNRHSQRDIDLVAMIFDGILEIGSGTEFFSGSRAYRSLVETDDELVGSGRIANMSMRALRMAQRFEDVDLSHIVNSLYSYQRLPVTPEWSRLCPDANGVRAYLGLTRGAGLYRDLYEQFEDVTHADSGNYWIYWRRPRFDRPTSPNSKHFKLYVSPNPEQVRFAFAELVKSLKDSPCHSLKIGASAFGLARPDKLIVYFETSDHLRDFAYDLLPRLSGVSAHGVPFSAPIDEAGLLSWGIDPPKEAATVSWLPDESWRMWLCNRLAASLFCAMKNPDPGVAPWRFALARLWLMGIDTRTWTIRYDSRGRHDNADDVSDCTLN